jgi:hypothetical protein
LGVFVGGAGVLVAFGLEVAVGGRGVAAGGASVGVMLVSVGSSGVAEGGANVPVGGGGVAVGGTGVSVGGIDVGVGGSGVSLGNAVGVGVKVAVNSGFNVLVGVAVMRACWSPPREQPNSVTMASKPRQDMKRTRFLTR